MKREKKEKLLQANRLKGTNQMAVGNYNERLIMHLVREHDTLTKAEATRATGLSANAISAIFRNLEEQNLLLRGEPIRGRIGQPSIPLRINPNAHHYLTVKIGRRSIEIAAVNFSGIVLFSKQQSLPFPTPNTVMTFVGDNMDKVLNAAGISLDLLSGLIVAMPFELWSWTEDFNAPSQEMSAWKDFDAVDALSGQVPCPVLIENDATAACRGQLVFGDRIEEPDWIYFYVGTFIGGGIVLNSNVYTGRRGTAGGFGPMRVPEQQGGNRLVDHASLVVLERTLKAKGHDPFKLYDENVDWGEFEPELSEWITRSSRNLVHAIISTLAVLDFQSVVIDGAFPSGVRERLVDAVQAELKRTDLQGVMQPNIVQGNLGRKARTVGAAAVHISKNYLVDQYWN